MFCHNEPPQTSADCDPPITARLPTPPHTDHNILVIITHQLLSEIFWWAISAWPFASAATFATCGYSLFEVTSWGPNGVIQKQKMFPKTEVPSNSQKIKIEEFHKKSSRVH